MLVNQSAGNSLSGMEWATGIPGTVGGAVRGNAGAFGRSMMNVVDSVEFFDIKNGQILKYDNEKCNFGYRSSIFKENFDMVELVGNSMEKLSINQYKTEERSILVKRLKSFHDRINMLLECMEEDTISSIDNVDLLKYKIHGWFVSLSIVPPCP